MARGWASDKADSGAVHCFGNGNFIVYATGPVLSGLQGPPYSAPSFGTLTPVGDPLHCSGERLPGTNVWQHTFADGTVLTDWLLPDANVFCREFSAAAPLTLRLAPAECTDVHFFPAFDLGGRPVDLLGLRMPMGTNFFTNIAVEQETWLLVAVQTFDSGAAGCDTATGAFSAEGGTPADGGTKGSAPAEGKAFSVGGTADSLPRVLRLGGNGRLLLAAGLLPDALDALTAALDTPAPLLRERVDEDWRRFFARVTDLGALLPADVPEELRRRVTAACESVALLIRCQQSADGGELAGHPYPLAYVRDMAGTLRGMLALGLREEARRVLTFWGGRFALHGNIHNAEGMGNLGGRLYFPNDTVEIPAYLLVSAFHYVRATGDAAVLDELFPMLRWAMAVQLPQLGGGMTCFSGDETYIAGGTLPRIHSCDGSAESTLLFLLGGEAFCGWCRAEGRLPADELTRYEAALDDVRARYKDNFCENGLLLANAPARLDYIRRPRCIRGFCEVHDTLHHQLVLGWNVFDEASGYYCCPACYGKPQAQPFDRGKRHLLSSASLLPFLYRDALEADTAAHGAPLFTENELADIARPYIDLFDRYGFVPSNAEGDRALGYDYGLFLAAASLLRLPQRTAALRAMLDVLDETGAWVEYYDRGTPFNCRSRPWESGMNMEAIRLLIVQARQ